MFSEVQVEGRKISIVGQKQTLSLSEDQRREGNGRKETNLRGGCGAYETGEL